MSSEAPADTPFHLSDYVDFDFNAENLHLQFTCGDDPFVDFDDAQDADFDGFIQLADGTYRLDNSPLADGIELAAQEMPRSASRWVLASPKLQRHLNTVYAPQLLRLATDPNPPPVLYLSAEGPNASYMPSIQSPPDEDLTWIAFPQMLPLNDERLSVNPPSLMQRRGKEISPLLLSNATNYPILSLGQRRGRVVAPLLVPKATNYVTHSVTNAHLSNARDPIPNSTKKRSLKANDSDSEFDSGPAPKRAKIAKSLSIAVHNEKADDELDNKLDDKSKAAADGGPYVSGPTATTKDSSVPSTGTSVPNRKRQRLLEEIKDTEEFAEAQGDEVRASVGRDAVQRRPVRKGARKSYTGLA